MVQAVKHEDGGGCGVVSDGIRNSHCSVMEAVNSRSCDWGSVHAEN